MDKFGAFKMPPERHVGVPHEVVFSGPQFEICGTESYLSRDGITSILRHLRSSRQQT